LPAASIQEGCACAWHVHASNTTNTPVDATLLAVTGAVLERHCAQSERPSTTTIQDPNHRHAQKPRQTKHLAGRTATSVSLGSWQCSCLRETARSSRLSLVRRSQQTMQRPRQGHERARVSTHYMHAFPPGLSQQPQRVSAEEQTPCNARTLQTLTPSTLVPQL
jgi:hypothetical protein